VYWVAKTLNEMGVKGPTGGIWAQDSARYVMLNRCYTGHHKYNANMRVPNPKRPLGDITGAVRRTLIRPKPAGETVEFSVPPLVSEELWLKANQATRERGRGRGKEGKSIAALLRNRMFCPGCGKPMVLKRRGTSDKFYYLCSRLAHASQIVHCSYRRFIPSAWDKAAWDCICAMLSDDGWIEEQLTTIENQHRGIDKLVKLERQRIIQSQAKIAKVREGFEGGLYDLNEAKYKVSAYQEAVQKAEQEINRLMGVMGDQNSTVKAQELRKELEVLAKENLDKTTFTEKRDIISKLGIKVYPSEDLKTMKIKCSLNFRNDPHSKPTNECAIIQFASLRSQ
jgi:hypothetical protein